jgi:hypothetical protein
MTHNSGKPRIVGPHLGRAFLLYRNMAEDTHGEGVQVRLGWRRRPSPSFCQEPITAIAVSIQSQGQSPHDIVTS